MIWERRGQITRKAAQTGKEEEREKEIQFEAVKGEGCKKKRETFPCVRKDKWVIIYIYWENDEM